MEAAGFTFIFRRLSRAAPSSSTLLTEAESMDRVESNAAADTRKNTTADLLMYQTCQWPCDALRAADLCATRQAAAPRA
eukprot:4774676-Pleurochrysis_carterae.AAC.1